MSYFSQQSNVVLLLTSDTCGCGRRIRVGAPHGDTHTDADPRFENLFNFFDSD
jgi:hypothetical protein